jgi:hypothetical protein
MKNSMKRLSFQIISLITGVGILSSCDYLDVVPDNIATIEENFDMRVSTERYLFTCYRYLPNHGNMSNDPAISGGDDYWYLYPYITTTGADAVTCIARGLQNASSPYLNHWHGDPFKGIRDCNIFLENIGRVPDMEEDEKNRWSAEVKFLKAYYHFWLFRMYGPIPLIRENLPISATVEEVKTYREPVNECVDYIVELLDDAAEYLPEKIDFEASELGRITQPICLSLKALVLLTAASPLFNGENSDYNDIEDNRGVRLFNASPDPQKWVKAADACADAIRLCQKYFKLYTYTGTSLSNDYAISSDITQTMVACRNSVSVKWNNEVIWANTQSTSNSAQQNATPAGLLASKYTTALSNQATLSKYSVPVKRIEQYYSRNGLPLSEDKTYDYAGRFNLRSTTGDDRYCLQPGYTTIGLHIDREPRFYASLAFDGGLWLGQGAKDDQDQYLLQCKAGQLQVTPATARTNVTGYWPKKLVNHESSPSPTANTYTITTYPWPLIRLADLYLMYAEALNEAYGPSGNAADTTDFDSPYTWLNKVRLRAGVPTVGEAWDNFAFNPNKCRQQNTLREIIRQERTIELAFEGHRFWDLRRWRTAHIELNQPITGWDYQQSEPEYYYRQKVLFNQTFTSKDYLWPIRESELLANRNLVQNFGY